MPRILIFDGNSIMHRAYHALPPLTSPRGDLVNAVYGFFSIWLSVLKQFEPEYAAIAFDVAGPTFRDKLFKDYKAKRVKPPQAFYDQIPLIKKLLSDIEALILEKTGFEADDLIGSLSVKLAEKNWQVVIVTSDQDAFQLIGKNTKVFFPKGLGQGKLWGEKEFKENFGFSPHYLIDYKALRGDPSDNIPGVLGIGQKTARDLVSKFGSLNKIYQNLDNLPERTRQLLKKNRSQAELSFQLAKIKTNVGIDFSPSKSQVSDFDQERVEKEFLKLGFKSLINRLPKSQRQKTWQQKLL